MIEFGNIEHSKRIEEAAELCFNPRCDVCLSRTDEHGNLLGGVIYTNYTGHSIHIHVAGFNPRWLSRDFLWVTFDYPFNQLMVEAIFAQVKSSNRHALEFDRKIGFQTINIMQDVYKDEACYVLKMKREDCRHLKIKPRTLLANI